MLAPASASRRVPDCSPRVLVSRQMPPESPHASLLLLDLEQLVACGRTRPICVLLYNHSLCAIILRQARGVLLDTMRMLIISYWSAVAPLSAAPAACRTC